MSLSLAPAFLASIAFAINSVEATPRLWRAEMIKRAEFSNAPASSTKKSETTKKTTTTKKSITTKKSTATQKSNTSAKSTASTASSSSAIAPSVSSSLLPTSTLSAITDLNTNTLLQPSSTANNLAATSAAASNTSGSGGGISGGAIGGIVAAIVIVVAGAAAYFVIAKKRKSNSRSRMSTKPDPFTMGFGSDQGFQPPMEQNQSMTNNYQPYNNQPGLAVTSDTVPYYQKNSNSTQFHDANTQFVPEVMPPALIPQQSVQQQYQPQLQPHVQPYADIDHMQADPSAVSDTTTAAVATVAAPAPAPAMPTKLQPTQPGSLGVYFVAATYTPTLSDEIDIQTGDQVEILVEYDDGWCQGINLTRGNAKGVFPKHCIDYSNEVQNTSTQPANENTENEVDRVKRVSSMYMA